jgi:hypothetical protein
VHAYLIGKLLGCSLGTLFLDYSIVQENLPFRSEDFTSEKQPRTSAITSDMRILIFVRFFASYIYI